MWKVLRHPERFPAGRNARAAAGKPICRVQDRALVESGARSAISHTGALAGADRMYDALFQQLGVIRAEKFSDLLDIPAALAVRRPLSGKRVAILTSYRRRRHVGH
ncbi:hypothetical protein ACFFYR_21500 [Paraburkholderia dipogonis]|uniref:hypothetical protein n=1 Tax=Paraburkholderia dipogonis TaxID=1211383 RepID=UPI0035EBDB55